MMAGSAKRAGAAGMARPLTPVMAGHSRSKNGVASLAYVPAIHAFFLPKLHNAWMPATSTGMTENGEIPRTYPRSARSFIMAARNSPMPAPVFDDVAMTSGNAAGCGFSAAAVSAIRWSSSAFFT
jgi:hypothetical protein